AVWRGPLRLPGNRRGLGGSPGRRRGQDGAGGACRRAGEHDPAARRDRKRRLSLLRRRGPAVHVRARPAHDRHLARPAEDRAPARGARGWNEEARRDAGPGSRRGPRRPDRRRAPGAEPAGGHGRPMTALPRDLFQWTPGREGYYGEFGGAFVPEILHETLTELRAAFD